MSDTTESLATYIDGKVAEIERLTREITSEITTRTCARAYAKLVLEETEAVRKATARRCAEIAYGPHTQDGNQIAREIEREFGL